ncbi:myeloid lymphoid or mixed-lineage leukemia 5 (trithorax, ) [Thoreauomyces humboldtii]|nr:myeloid lymphoid or mixed-lineage leukemia 5 (trithorax, ) [Thoreauomyces humboldtii]
MSSSTRRSLLASSSPHTGNSQSEKRPLGRISERKRRITETSEPGSSGRDLERENADGGLDDEDEESDEESDEEDPDDVIRCICVYTDDDGNTIACDDCAVWQHMLCVGVDPNNVPDFYRCEECAPRSYDPDFANQLQRKHREQKRSAKNGGNGGRDRLSRSRLKPKEVVTPAIQRTSAIKALESASSESSSGKPGRGRPKGRGVPKTPLRPIASSPEPPRRKPQVTSAVPVVRQPPPAPERRQRAQHQLFRSSQNGQEKIAKPADSFEAEYHNYASQFGEISFNRFASNEVASRVERICKDWTPTTVEGVRSSKEMAVTLSPDWLRDHIPIASWVAVAADPVSNVRRFGLFTTDDVPADAFVTDIKGTLVKGSELVEDASKLRKATTSVADILPPFVFGHPAIKDLGEDFFIDARNWSEWGGKFVRYTCGAEESVANAELRTVLLQGDDGGPLNGRLILGIFTTRSVPASTELVLASDGCLGYPCTCKDAASCRLAKAVRLYEEQLVEEKDIAEVSARNALIPPLRELEQAKPEDEEEEMDDPEDESTAAISPSHETDYVAPTSLDPGKRMSREEKKFQDHLARIGRMQAEEDRKRARTQRRRTKSGDAPEDEIESPPGRKRQREAPTPEPPIKPKEVIIMTTSVEKKSAASSPPRRPRGLKGWIFAQEEAKRAREREMEEQRSVELAPSSDAEKPLDSDSSLKGSSIQKLQKRRLSDSPPPLRAGSTDGETPRIKKSKIESVSDEGAPAASTASDKPQLPLLPSTPAIRKVSLQEFMAKKKRLHEASLLSLPPSTPATPDSTSAEDVVTPPDGPSAVWKHDISAPSVRGKVSRTRSVSPDPLGEVSTPVSDLEFEQPFEDTNVKREQGPLLSPRGKPVTHTESINDRHFSVLPMASLASIYDAPNLTHSNSLGSVHSSRRGSIEDLSDVPAIDNSRRSSFTAREGFPNHQPQFDDHRRPSTISDPSNMDPYRVSYRRLSSASSHNDPPAQQMPPPPHHGHHLPRGPPYMRSPPPPSHVSAGPSPYGGSYGAPKPYYHPERGTVAQDLRQNAFSPRHISGPPPFRHPPPQRYPGHHGPRDFYDRSGDVEPDARLERPEPMTMHMEPASEVAADFVRNSREREWDRRASLSMVAPPANRELPPRHWEQPGPSRGPERGSRSGLNQRAPRDWERDRARGDWDRDREREREHWDRGPETRPEARPTTPPQLGRGFDNAEPTVVDRRPDRRREAAWQVDDPAPSTPAVAGPVPHTASFGRSKAFCDFAAAGLCCELAKFVGDPASYTSQAKTPCSRKSQPLAICWAPGRPESWRLLSSGRTFTVSLALAFASGPCDSGPTPPTSPLSTRASRCRPSYQSGPRRLPLPAYFVGFKFEKDK